ncbi:hypothetical protein DMR_09830 [Solidesulfovibrio magneticus RS-1]|uniref:Uncharacterized protein n=1 Tax=Solidesulfovibrio magneticus (strain ATCC 700980 / DSM 13731 / RS-1) TaxID=573370 RepID=C4XKT5_SOLM1|nr:hypothetical protein DMR_09830 [Solidesulfovibrio magneticus RS-1]
MKAFFFFLTEKFTHLLDHPASIHIAWVEKIALAPGTPPRKIPSPGFFGPVL